ncbi:cyclopropane-fatty-acyl-phospholipid synthase [Flagelloscypha sp. PMI_526]|nr:cyclopropane-fatty-acyl-phospholipid synthase [Flagelloscypha sp. PMI_526]
MSSPQSCVQLDIMPSSVSLSLPSPSSILASLARNSILSVLDQSIQNGYLSVSDSQGTNYYGAYSKGCNSVHLKVLSDNFWIRLLLSGDLGFSEAFMIGEVEVNNLKGAMDLWLDNQDGMDSTLTSLLSRVSSSISGIYNCFLGQTRSQARLNAMASYDQSNELFKAFLSSEMMYSCALWSDEEGGVRGDIVNGLRAGDLETAQLRKIHHVLHQARVKPGHRLLEFGSGWGGLAIVAAREYGCEVDTLTLSVEQKVLAEERIAEEGLSEAIRVHLLDYRDIPSDWKHSFDAFISIEMFEHVGSSHYNAYFKLVDFALKPSNATAVVSASSFPESRFTGYQAEDFMRRYMWPNSCLPSATAMITAASTGAQGRLTVQRVENHAAHYPRTLREWNRRLEANLTQELIAEDYPALKETQDYQAFKRKWEYLFAYAGAGFAKGYITCHMLTFIRPNDWPERCD